MLLDILVWLSGCLVVVVWLLVVGCLSGLVWGLSLVRLDVTFVECDAAQGTMRLERPFNNVPLLILFAIPAYSTYFTDLLSFHAKYLAECPTGTEVRAVINTGGERNQTAFPSDVIIFLLSSLKSVSSSSFPLST